MKRRDWIGKLPAAATVCDREGVILEMNEAAVRVFESDGGAALLGRNLFDCHPESASAKIRTIAAERRANVYFIRKGGRRKLIYQAPWFDERGGYAGLVELSFEVPAVIPEFDRDKPGA